MKPQFTLPGSAVPKPAVSHAWQRWHTARYSLEPMSLSISKTPPRTAAPSTESRRATTPPRTERPHTRDTFVPSSRAKQDTAVDATTATAPTEVPRALAHSRAFSRLSEPVQARVTELYAGADATGRRNLVNLIGDRHFSELGEPQQREMLEVWSRHPTDRFGTSGLRGLLRDEGFRSSTPEAQSAAIRDAWIPSGHAVTNEHDPMFDTGRRGDLRRDGISVFNTTPPEAISHLEVHGRTIDVYGASESELRTIRNSLERLPPSHLDAIPPRIVVADTIAHGQADSGGCILSDAGNAEWASTRPGRAVADEGWTDPARFELTHAALARDASRPDGLSLTVLHETGHAVDDAHRLSGGLSPEDLGNIDYNGGNGGRDGLGPVRERFADAYQQYLTNPEALRSRDPVAYETVRRALERVPDRE